MEVQQLNASTWEAKKNRHSEKHTHTQVKRQADVQWPGVGTWEAVTKEFGWLLAREEGAGQRKLVRRS